MPLLYYRLHHPHRERPIASRITVAPTDHPPTSDDPLASQRLELLGRLAAAQLNLEAAIAELARNHAPADVARAQLEALGDLQRQIASAGPAALAGLRGEIAAATAASQAVVQQGRAATSAETAEAALAAASARTRATVQRVAGDLFERRIFDPYLQFASAEDEETYRRREAERRAEIERELARGTPEGNLNASAATVGQVLDAGAHGADRSTDYRPTLGSAVDAYRDQRDSMIAAGRSTAEADQRMADDVRRYLRSRGLSDAEIEARLAGAANPADALGSTHAESAGELHPAAPPTADPATPTGLGDVAAALRAAGVVGQHESEQPGHGLTAQALALTQAFGRA